MIQQQKRNYQHFGKQYMTGFDRMLLDKLNWSRFNGHWFALFGIGNLMCFGLSLIMNKDNYQYHFAYTGEERSVFRPFKSMLGSDNFVNVAWTSAALVGLNMYLVPTLGALRMSKFFLLSMLTSYGAVVMFSPSSGLHHRPVSKFAGIWDSHATDGSYLMGADQMAQAIIYFTMLRFGLWPVALPLMGFDLLTMGPQTLGGPAAAIVGAMVFL